MEDAKITLSKNITELRLLNNMTQVELAKELNYSDKTISKWERGESTPDINVLVEMSDPFWRYARLPHQRNKRSGGGKNLSPKIYSGKIQPPRYYISFAGTCVVYCTFCFYYHFPDFKRRKFSVAVLCVRFAYRCNSATCFQLGVVQSTTQLLYHLTSCVVDTRSDSDDFSVFFYQHFADLSARCSGRNHHYSVVIHQKAEKITTTSLNLKTEYIKLQSSVFLIKPSFFRTLRIVEWAVELFYDAKPVS